MISVTSLCCESIRNTPHRVLQMVVLVLCVYYILPFGKGKEITVQMYQCMLCCLSNQECPAELTNQFVMMTNAEIHKTIFNKQLIHDLISMGI